MFKKALAILLTMSVLLGMGSVALADNADATYTYNTYTDASPLNWNPHAWENSGESDLMSFIVGQLVYPIVAEDGVNFEWCYDLADAVTDITADFADKEKWGIPADATEHYVYQVDLNEKGAWANGDPINADTYIYSMQQLLSPEMKNYRANTYMTGSTAIKNAGLYYNSDKAGQPIYADVAEGVADEDMMITMTQPIVFFGDTAKAYYDTEDYKAMFMNGEEDLYAKYATEDYVPLTDEAKADLLVIANNFGDANPEAYKEFCVYATGVYEAIDFDGVGLYKTGDYQFVYILEKPSELFYLLSNFTSNWIVYEPLYEAGKSVQGSLTVTNYGTSADTYMSSGPYKLASFEKDKQMMLEKNENWVGFLDGRHEGQYQATSVRYDIISEHNTALMLFNQGNLDTVELVGDDLATYRMSDNLLKTDETYTFRWIFATSMESLTQLENEAKDGSNKRVLVYDDFRKAISLSMDRATFCAQATGANKPAYYLFNSLYYYNIANDTESIYRNTPQAKQAVLDLYDIKYGEGTMYETIDEAYNAVTGYDVEAARELFQSVYEKAIADGNYTDGQAININAMVSAAAAMSADDTKQQDLMNEFVAEATKGTGFEGKITFTFSSGAPNRYDDVANGRIEMIRGAWGGAAFYPFSNIRLYTEPDYMGGLNKIHESNGWNPTVEKMSVTYDFDGDGTAETKEDTFQNWAISINTGEYYANPDICMVILSAMEANVLASYQCIPWGVSVVPELFSQKIKFRTEDYNIMYNYGGVRQMTFNYSDAEWAAYVAAQGGTLSYE